MRTKAEMEQALRADGCRITRQRSAILEYLAATDTHPSARQVYREVKRSLPEVSLATVYNTLGKLVRMNILKLIDYESLDNRYDRDPGLHINLVCTGCGRIQDLEPGVPASSEEIRAQAGFSVQDVRLEYYGKCAECGTRAASGAGHPRTKRRKA